MRNWNRWLLCGALSAGALACGSENDGAALDDGLSNVVGEDASEPATADAAMQTFDAGTPYAESDADIVTIAVDAATTECDGLKATIRDFKPETNPDFEKAFTGYRVAPGIVRDTLGGDNKPVFAASRDFVTSASTFSQWYNDVPGVNQTVQLPALALKPMASGGFEYDNSSFFPLDGMGFGNYANTGHNFHFTTEIHTSFTYEGGERFTFRGDDDLWIFVNGKLALDLGGVHPVEQGTIDFDAQAQKLGIMKGQTYRMDIFHAERHTDASNFRISTNIKCFKDVVLM